MSEALTAVDAARAVEATYAGGDPVAVVTVVTGPSAGRRLLVHAAEPPPDPTADAAPGAGPTREAAHSVVVTGTLGSPTLDAAARSLGLHVLARGGTLLETVPPATPADEAHTDPATTEAASPPPTPAVTLFAEAYLPPEELVIVGAGHIAVPLAELGGRLGYRVVVLDDREAFVDAERFPPETEVLRTDFADPFRSVRISRRSHLVLVTRAHRYDYDCLLHLLRGETTPRYIGMIGSRRRVRATFQALLEAGIPPERIALVRAPVGLEIGAETPAEIAVSIAAELIMLRRGVPDATPLATCERVLERLLPATARASTAKGEVGGPPEGEGHYPPSVVEIAPISEPHHG